MTPFQVGVLKRANELAAANQLGDEDAARLMQLIAQQKQLDPSQGPALDRFAGIAPQQPSLQDKLTQIFAKPAEAPAPAQAPVTAPVPQAQPTQQPATVKFTPPAKPAVPAVNTQTPPINPQQPTEKMFQMPAKTSAFKEGFSKRAFEYGFNEQETEKLVKSANQLDTRMLPQWLYAATGQKNPAKNELESLNRQIDDLGDVSGLVGAGVGGLGGAGLGALVAPKGYGRVGAGLGSLVGGVGGAMLGNHATERALNTQYADIINQLKHVAGQ